MFMGFWQLIIILLVVMVLFGAGRIPKVMGDLGSGIRSFKEGLNGKEEDEKEDKPFLTKDEKSDK